MGARRGSNQRPPGLAVRAAGGWKSAFRDFYRLGKRRTGFLAAAVIIGFLAGLAYRALVDDPEGKALPNFIRSGLHGVGVGAAAWTVQTAFASGARSRFGSALRRLPLAGELVARALVMTAVLVVVGLSLQFVLYAEPLGLRWLTRDWFLITLPRIVAMGFGMALVAGALSEARRLIGGPLLASVLLGTYHRPVRRELIVMFLDIGNSTRLAETMGELRVHDLITRFFSDIDEPITDYGGAVHAYVGDEVIVSWPVAADPARNASCLACFFAIHRKMVCLADEYADEFGVAPTFRAAIHAGPVIVSECGDEKRQLAFFGDTMNVTARLCEYCKAIDQRLVVSGGALGLMKVLPDTRIGAGATVKVRGREKPIEAHVVELMTGRS